jgi:hypothetical protein
MFHARSLRYLAQRRAVALFAVAIWSSTSNASGSSVIELSSAKTELSFDSTNGNPLHLSMLSLPPAKGWPISKVLGCRYETASGLDLSAMPASGTHAVLSVHTGAAGYRETLVPNRPSTTELYTQTYSVPMTIPKSKWIYSSSLALLGLFLIRRKLA